MKKAAALSALALLAVVPYVLFSSRASFVWDDYDLIVNNPVVREWSSAHVAQIFTSAHMGLYAPLVYFSFTLEHFFFRLNPAIYHFDNAVLYALNVLAVYFFCRALGSREWPSWTIAALFAAHPAHVESVAWASQRKDLLYGLFFWLAAIFYVRERRGAAIIFFALSLLSKPMGVALPLVLLAYEWAYGVPSKGRAARLGVFFAMAAAMAFLTVTAFHGEGAIRPGGFSLASVQLTCYSALFYVVKTFWPLPQSCFYPFPKETDFLFMAAPVILTVVGWVIAWAARKRKESALGALFFFIMLLPLLQIVPVGDAFAADRYLFVALFGPIFALASVWDRKAIFLAAALLCVWTGVSYARTTVWQNDIALWSDVLRQYPDEVIAYYNRGRGHQMNGALREALADYDQALERRPHYADARINRGIILGMMGELEKARANFDQVIKEEPQNADAYYNRGVAYAMEGKLDLSRADFRKVLEINPGYEDAQSRLDSLGAQS